MLKNQKSFGMRNKVIFGLGIKFLVLLTYVEPRAEAFNINLINNTGNNYDYELVLFRGENLAVGEQFVLSNMDGVIGQSLPGLSTSAQRFFALGGFTENTATFNVIRNFNFGGDSSTIETFRVTSIENQGNIDFSGTIGNRNSGITQGPTNGIHFEYFGSPDGLTRGIERKDSDGFTLRDLEYTIIANTLDPIQINPAWRSKQAFSLTKKQKLSVNLSGNTQVDYRRGLVNDFFVRGLIDDREAIKFNPINLISGDYSWNIFGSLDNVSAGNHELIMESGFTWTPERIGDTLTISSQYGIAKEVVVVPEPQIILSSLAMGVIALGTTKKRKVKSSLKSR